MPIDKIIEKIDTCPIPLGDTGIDVPTDFDPGYEIQTQCDCGNNLWEPGDFKLGHSTITGEQFIMKANLCTLCKAPQLWISKQYLKMKGLNGTRTIS